MVSVQKTKRLFNGKHLFSLNFYCYYHYQSKLFQIFTARYDSKAHFVQYVHTSYFSIYLKKSLIWTTRKQNRSNTGYKSTYVTRIYSLKFIRSESGCCTCKNLLASVYWNLYLSIYRWELPVPFIYIGLHRCIPYIHRFDIHIKIATSAIKMEL